jgi:regulatory protein
MNPPSKSARNKMMDLLARRDHSEKEIRTKLEENEFPSEEIESALQYGRDHNWLPQSEEQNVELSEKMAQSLHRKGKGAIYINHFLEEKGLPPIAQDPDIELEKARQLLENKPSLKAFSDPLQRLKHKEKLMRFLSARGFSLETIEIAIK